MQAGVYAAASSLQVFTLHVRASPQAPHL